MGNSLALYNPPTRVAEEFAMIDCISGGRLIAGFPVGTPMDTCYAYGQNPAMLRERYLEAHDLVMRAWTEHGHLRLQRPLQPAALRQHLAAPDPAAASADLDPRRRLGRDLAVVRARWTTSTAYLSYFGYKDGQATMDGFWNEMARLGKDRNPYRAGFLQFVGVARAASRPGAVPRAGRIFLRPLPARRSDVGDAAGLHHRGDAARRHAKPGRPAADGDLRGSPPAHARRTEMQDIVDHGYVIIGSPDEVAEQLARGRRRR